MKEWGTVDEAGFHGCCFGMGGGFSEPLLAAMVRKERKVEEGHVGRYSFRVRNGDWK